MSGKMEKLPKSPSRQTEDFIYLVACALENRIPDLQKVNQMNLEQMYRLSRRHFMSAMIYMVLAQSGIWNEKTNDGEKDFVEKWKEKKEKIIRTTLLMDAESQALYQYMEENAIWYMPLKGAIMASFYPRYGMREMSDRDILYDATYQKQLCEWMKERGYSAKSVGVGNHDVYEKMPVYHFEMHTGLFDKSREKWYRYYRNIKQRLIRDEKINYRYHFSDEDFYIYMIVHMYKHLQNAGTGIRGLADLYLYLKEKNSVLDWVYIRREVKKLEVDAFEQISRSLCQKLFSNVQTDLTQKEQIQLDYMLESGVYGTLSNYMENEAKKIRKESQNAMQARLKYIWKNMFLTPEQRERINPFLRHKWSIPFWVLYRRGRAVLFKRSVIKTKLEILRKIK